MLQESDLITLQDELTSDDKKLCLGHVEHMLPGLLAREGTLSLKRGRPARTRDEIIHNAINGTESERRLGRFLVPVVGPELLVFQEGRMSDRTVVHDDGGRDIHREWGLGFDINVKWSRVKRGRVADVLDLFHLNVPGKIRSRTAYVQLATESDGATLIFVGWASPSDLIETSSPTWRTLRPGSTLISIIKRSQTK